MALPIIPMIVTAVSTALLSTVGKLAIKVVTALGFGYVSYKGIEGLLDKFRSEVARSYGSLPSDLMAFMDIAGFTEGIEIMFGGFGVYVALIVVKRFEFLGGAK